MTSIDQLVNSQTHFTHDELMEMIALRVPPERISKQFGIITDASDFFRVDYNDVLILGGRPYLIRNYEREGRFGIDDEPKFWVKRAVDLIDGGIKIIKMVFREQFNVKVGDLIFDCVRSPKKEARILDIVRGHPNFMQGFAAADAAQNIIRIIDFIPGKTMADYILECGKNHEDYFYNYFPLILDEYIELARAIGFIHNHNEKHGDIRRDHIIRDGQTGICRWIDFDFNYQHKENMFGYDLFGLGNILIYLTGRGDLTIQQLKKDSPSLFGKIITDDLNIIFNNRVVNLKKIHSYIPKALNNILLHFSLGADVFYENTGQLLNDLYEVREVIN